MHTLIFSILITVLGINTLPQQNLQNRNKAFTGVKIYALPIATVTRRPMTRKDLKSYYEIKVFIKDEEIVDDVLEMLGNLEIRKPLKYDDVRIQCKLFKDGKKISAFFINRGNIVIIDNKYYERNEEFVDYILSLLPSDYGY